MINNQSLELTIRPYELADIEPLFQAARSSIEEIYPWLPWCHPQYKIEDSRNWIIHTLDAWASQNEFNFVVVDGYNQVLGGVGLNRFDFEHRTCNLGYWVRSGFTGKNIATKATIFAARFGFTELNLNRIEIIMSVQNLASIRVAEKTGATLEGIMKDRIFLHEVKHDTCLYALTNLKQLPEL